MTGDHRLTDIVHRRLAMAVRTGDCAVDATAGNGHDTVRLAELVGPVGHVWAFDIQSKAVETVQSRLMLAGITWVRVLHRSHADMADGIESDFHGLISAVTFNLGYLPGGEKRLTTQSASTVSALQRARRLLRPGGLISIVAYRGHHGGPEEAEAVRVWADESRGNGDGVEVMETASPRRPGPIWTVVTAGQ